MEENAHEMEQWKKKETEQLEVCYHNRVWW